jgi:hypothetical protein
MAGTAKPSPVAVTFLQGERRQQNDDQHRRQVAKRISNAGFYFQDIGHRRQCNEDDRRQADEKDRYRFQDALLTA